MRYGDREGGRERETWVALTGKPSRTQPWPTQSSSDSRSRITSTISLHAVRHALEPLNLSLREGSLDPFKIFWIIGCEHAMDYRKRASDPMNQKLIRCTRMLSSKVNTAPTGGLEKIRHFLPSGEGRLPVGEKLARVEHFLCLYAHHPRVDARQSQKSIP